MKRKVELIVSSCMLSIILVIIIQTIVMDDLNRSILIGVCSGLVVTIIIGITEYDLAKEKLLHDIKRELMDLLSEVREVDVVKVHLPLDIIKNHLELRYYKGIQKELVVDVFDQHVEHLEGCIKSNYEKLAKLHPKIGYSYPHLIIGDSDVVRLEDTYVKIIEFNTYNLENYIRDFLLFSDIFKKENKKTDYIKGEITETLNIMKDIRNNENLFGNKYITKPDSVNLVDRVNNLLGMNNLIYQYQIKQTNDHCAKIGYCNIFENKLENIIDYLDKIEKKENIALQNDATQYKNSFVFFYIENDDLEFWKSSRDVEE